jgi:hypothetical protein
MFSIPWHNEIVLFSQSIGISEVAQTVSVIAAFGALFFSARASFHTQTLRISINGRMEKLLEATAASAAAQAREATRQELILASLQDASEQNYNNEDDIEQARLVGFNQGRIFAVEQLRKRRKHNKFRGKKVRNDTP